MDEVHGLRDRYGADLVALIVGRNTEIACGVGWIPDPGKYPSFDWSVRGFSVTAHNCETITHHTFAHELGHNQGAHHDPDNTCEMPPCTLRPPPTFPYRYGRCNPAEGWNTIMSYASNSQGDCRREIEYFSSPVLDYRGTPTGDAGVRDNRRVLNETAYRLANYRQSVARSHTLPFVTSASNVGQPGFVRVINRTNRGGSVRIVAIDDSGQRFGPVNMWLPGRHTRHFSSKELEQGGNRQLTGLSRGVGDGAGNWRLQLVTDLEIEPLAYIRRADGFVTSMHEVAAETRAGSRWRYRVPFFNPASDRRNISHLRLINPGSVHANIVISGVDDQGKAQPGSVVRLTMRAGTAHMLTAQQLEQGDLGGPDQSEAGTARMLTEQQLEQGDSGFSSRFGAGSGRWQLLVSSNRPIQVMSLLRGPTGHLANLSRGQAVSSDGGPPPPNRPDLVVSNPSVSNRTPNARQTFTLRATVRNQGNARSAATTLRYYRSSDGTISTADAGVGSDAVGGLSASGTSNESIVLRAPSSAGTYYYGACVNSVSGESNTNNNCSSAVRVTVQGTPPSTYVGAIAPGWRGAFCATGYGWGFALNYTDRNAAISRATSECQSLGLLRCSWIVTFADCGALAYGETSTSCTLYGGYGTTKSAAEQDALSDCRETYSNCRISVGTSGSRASYCNANAQTTPHAEVRSSSDTIDIPFSTSNSDSRPEPSSPRRGDGG